MKQEKQTEQAFVDVLVKYLSKSLTIEEEVWSDCKKGRIDLIATTKEGYRLGIECKKNNRKRGEEMGKFISQALRYKSYYFNGSKIPIFIAPSLSYNYFVLSEETKEIDSKEFHLDRHDKTHEHHSFNGFLGEIGCGEIRSNGSFLYFSYSNKIVWSGQTKYKSEEVKGTHEVNYKRILNKINL